MISKKPLTARITPAAARNSICDEFLAVFEQEFPNRDRPENLNAPCANRSYDCARDERNHWPNGQPKYLRVGVMRTNDVEDYERGQEKLEALESCKTPMGQRKRDNKNNEQDVFEEPGLSRSNG